MSYNYGAPPPPPPPPNQAAPQPYGSHPSYGQGHRGGGTQGRGRGGVSYASGSYGAGRGEYQQVAAQPAYSYTYPPSTPAQYSSEAGYQGQWQPEHTHGHGQAPPPQGHHGGHAPSPIATSNYHPNYAQPGYSQHAQYSAHGGYGPAQPQYSSPYGTAPPPSPQWAAGQASPPAQQVYSAPRPHHRGSYQADRGASRGGPVGQGGRGAYREEASPAQVSASYGAQYADTRPPPAAQYAPPPAQAYQYAPPPPPPPQAVGGAPRQDHYYGHNNRRGGRGGFRGDGSRGGRANFPPRHDKPGFKKPHHPAGHGNHGEHAPKSEQPGPGKKKKRKVNTLGLTPGNASGSEEEDEDDDGEEARLSELMGNEAFLITDVGAYLADRMKKYPTTAHIEAKKTAELAAQSEKAEETSRLEKERERLKRRLQRVESSIKRKREQQDEGDEMRDSSDNESSDDEKPEVQSSHAAAGSEGSREDAGPPLPPAKRADITRHCKYYSTGGSCGKKGKCRFVHDPAVREAAIKEKEANNGQLTIKQRLILNDKDQEDLAILESIQYIREKGLAKTGSGLGKGNNSPRPPAEAPARQAKVGTLPAPPPSLPAPPPKSSAQHQGGGGGGGGLYQGWNLGGYGGTGIKSEDLP